MSEVRWSTDTAILVDPNLKPNNMSIKVNLVDDGSANIKIDDIYGPAGDYDYYDGAYVVEPDWEEQTLQTKDKLMYGDVTVEGIYMTKVTNQAGGKTVYIGGLINDG